MTIGNVSARKGVIYRRVMDDPLPSDHSIINFRVEGDNTLASLTRNHTKTNWFLHKKNRENNSGLINRVGKTPSPRFERTGKAG